MFTEELVSAARKIGQEMDNLYDRVDYLDEELRKEKSKTKAFAEIVREALKKLEED